MSVFGNYSNYYNLLYRDKDYAAEVDYIEQLIHEFNPNSREILDLGCGTGNHDIFLGQRGFSVVGVDRSEEMLAAARESLASENFKNSELVSFFPGDIRDLRLDRFFDVVISLFHVMSYQPSNDDQLNAFQTAAAHLKPGGIFIFDCWYGPGVLMDPPTVRVKDLEDDIVSVSRIARPAMHLHENLVDVNYHITICDKATKKVNEIKERHSMRYLFRPEVELFLKETGFKLLNLYAFMKSSPPGPKEWNACFICKKEI